MEETLHLQIRSKLEDMGEPGLASFASGLIPGLSHKMLGVRLPLLRTYAQKLAREEGERVLREGLSSDSFEEIMLRGLLIGYIPMSWESRWQEICKFVPFIDNWSVCDSCCATYKEVRAHREEVWPSLVEYLQSPAEFEQRFAVVMMLDHFLVDDFQERVLCAWKQVHPAGFYAEMALGWGLSVAFLRYPEAVLGVLKNSHFSVDCRKRACQKILESRRTPEHYRAMIRKMRSQLVCQ